MCRRGGTSETLCSLAEVVTQVRCGDGDTVCLFCFMWLLMFVTTPWECKHRLKKFVGVSCAPITHTEACK